MLFADQNPETERILETTQSALGRLEAAEKPHTLEQYSYDYFLPPPKRTLRHTLSSSTFRRKDSGQPWSFTRVRGLPWKGHGPSPELGVTLSCLSAPPRLPSGSHQEAIAEEIEQPIRGGAAEGVSGVPGYPFMRNAGAVEWVGSRCLVGGIQMCSGWDPDV